MAYFYDLTESIVPASFEPNYFYEENELFGLEDAVMSMDTENTSPMCDCSESSSNIGYYDYVIPEYVNMWQTNSMYPWKSSEMEESDIEEEYTDDDLCDTYLKEFVPKVEGFNIPLNKENGPSKMLTELFKLMHKN